MASSPAPVATSTTSRSNRISDFERSLLRFLEQNHPDLEKTIVKEGAVSAQLEAELRAAIEDFKKDYA